MSVALLQTPPLSPSLQNLLTQKPTYHWAYQENCADNEAASKDINWTSNDRGKQRVRTRTVAFMSFQFKATSPVGRNIIERRRNNHKLKEGAVSSGKVGLSKLLLNSSYCPFSQPEHSHKCWNPASFALGNHHPLTQAGRILLFIPIFLLTETNYSPTFQFRPADHAAPHTFLFLNKAISHGWFPATPAVAHDSSAQGHLNASPIWAASQRDTPLYPGGDLLFCLPPPVQIYFWFILAAINR